MLAMAQRGWQSPPSIFRPGGRARRKAQASARFDSSNDVTRLDDAIDYLDLGCFHSLEPAVRSGYVSSLTRLLRPQAIYMLYAFLGPVEGWPAESEIRRLLGTGFALAMLEHGDFNGRPSGWFTWIRRP
jgi:hypothetical protein